MSPRDVDRRVACALFLDADNVSDAGSVERAIAWLAERDVHLSIRRAYGGHDKLGSLRDVLLKHGFRTMVNQGRGTTDALLVIDVMDLLHAGALPGRVAVVSSDCDFAPLATRLRESGAWVCCFAQRGKADGEGLEHAYDELVYLEAAPAAKRPARKTAGGTRQAARAPAPAPVEEPPPRSDDPEGPLWEVLRAIPGLASGQAVALNDVVKRLRDAKLLGKSVSGPRFLAKHAQYLELIPANKPTKARLATG